MASGVDFQKKDLFKDCKGECEIKERDVELRRFIVPIVAQFLLLVLEISVIALSGEILVSEGNGTIRSPLLVPIEGTAPLMADRTPTAIESCRNELLLTEFRQPLQVQSHLEMPGILVQLGHIQRT